MKVTSNITDTIPHDEEFFQSLNNSYFLHDSSARPSNRRPRSPAPQPQHSVRRRIASPAASIPSLPMISVTRSIKTRLPAMTTTLCAWDISIEPVNLTQETSITDETVYGDESYSTESSTTYQQVEGSTQRQGCVTV